MVVSEAKKKQQKVVVNFTENEEENIRNLMESYTPSSRETLTPEPTASATTESNSLVQRSEHIYVSKMSGSQLEFQSFESSCYLLYQYKCVIQVPVDRTTRVIVGTELTVDSLLFNDKESKKEYDLSTKSVLLLKTSREMIGFTRIEGISMNKSMGKTFPVEVHFNSSFKTMRMEGMTESLWQSLQLVIEVSKRIFKEIVPVQHYLLNEYNVSEKTNDDDKKKDNSQVVMQKLLLVVDIWTYKVSKQYLRRDAFLPTTATGRPDYSNEGNLTFDHR